MNRVWLLLVLSVVVSGTSSCRLYKRISGRKPVVAVVDSSLLTIHDSVLSSVDTGLTLRDTSIANTPSLHNTDSQLLGALLPKWNSQTAWNTFNGKAKVHFEAKGESQDFAATIRMEKGKTVWVSVTALGLFEAARVLITPDSIQILDRTHKEARILPFNESSQLLPIHADFASLQSLIIGDVLQTGHQPTDALDTALAFVLSHFSPDFSQSLQFDKADTLLRLQAIATGGTFLLSEYSGYNSDGNRRFAANRNINMNDKGEPYNLGLEFSKASFDEAVEMPFSIPDKYERK